MLDIQIKTIKHNKQRYETVGDWQWKGSTLIITVSEMCDWRKEALVAIHEAVEALLCKHEEITGKDVDVFDMEYENARRPDDWKSEPGDDPTAPYHEQHKFATVIERLFSMELGVNWHEYEQTIQNL